MQRSGALFPHKPTPTHSNGEAVQLYTRNNPGVSQLARNSLFNFFVGGREEHLAETCAGIKEHLAGWGAVWSWGTFWPLCALLMPVDLPSQREGKGRGKALGQQEGGDLLLCRCAATQNHLN